MATSDSNKALKLLGGEAVLVILVILVIAILVFKPFSFLQPRKSQTPPTDMTRSVGLNGKITNITPPVAPPIQITIVLNEKGFDPQVASASATGTVITFINNTIMPQSIEFSSNLTPPADIAPNVSWVSPNIVAHGKFTYTIKNNGNSGVIEFK